MACTCYGKQFCTAGSNAQSMRLRTKAGGGSGNGHWCNPFWSQHLVSVKRWQKMQQPINQHRNRRNALSCRWPPHTFERYHELWGATAKSALLPHGPDGWRYTASLSMQTGKCQMGGDFG
jgi:hypothetical protein